METKMEQIYHHPSQQQGQQQTQITDYNRAQLPHNQQHQQGLLTQIDQQPHSQNHISHEQYYSVQDHPLHKLPAQQHQQHLNQVPEQQNCEDENDEVMQQLTALARDAQNTDDMVQAARDCYQNFVLQIQTRGETMRTRKQYAHDVSINEQMGRSLDALEESLRRNAKILNENRRSLLQAEYNIFNRLLVIQNSILYEFLPKWHYEEQLLSNGVEISSRVSLDRIQKWIERIVEITWRIKNQIKGLQLTLTEKPNIPFNTEELNRFVVNVNKALENLILSSFVVEKQPPQVMKTNTRFTATVRFLCGDKLNFQLCTPTVKALILSETNARTVIRYHKQMILSSWSSLDNSQIHHSHQHHQSTNISPNQSHATTPQPMLYHTDTECSTTCRPVDKSQVSNNLEQPSPIVGGQVVPPPSQQQFHQQPSPSQQMHQYQSHITSRGGNTITVTNQHQLRQQLITHIGYNPDVPINSKDFECSGEILNNSNILEFQESTGHMVSHFKNMQLKKIKRTEKKGTESVMDEKFVLLFFTNFRVADDSFWPHSIETSSRVKRGDLYFHILAFSLPVVVIVHGNQEPHAWATITWHNAFAKPDELLYRVPDKVQWRELGNVLSEKFRSCAGRGLSQENLAYLANKVTRSHVQNDGATVTWNQFSKDLLADRTFTFWEYFHSILKLTKEHLRDLWQGERIYGFVGKKGCVDLLLGSAYSEPAQIGTFLLRYSETELGGIAIAWVSNLSSLDSMHPSLNDRVQISKRLSPINGSANVVLHLHPYVGKDLLTRSLADRIRDLPNLLYLYPNLSKTEAIEPFCTPISKPNSNWNVISSAEYIIPELKETLPDKYAGTVKLRTCLRDGVVSVTPNSVVSQSSPEEYYQDNSLPMNDMMDTTNYQTYGTASDNTYNNYTIQ